MNRKFYAISWTYGVASNSQGNRLCDVEVFSSQIARDTWVNQGPPYRSDAGYRECVKRSELTRKELESAR